LKREVVVHFVNDIVVNDIDGNIGRHCLNIWLSILSIFSVPDEG